MTISSESVEKLYPDDIWKQVSEGRWERAINHHECLWYSFGRLLAGTGRIAFAVTGHLSITIESKAGTEDRQIRSKVESAFQNAWEILRYDYPTLASRVVYYPTAGFRKIYEVVRDQTDIDQWLKRTFHVVSTSMTGEQWCNADPPGPKEALLFLVFCQHEGSNLGFDIVFRAPHETIDGMGTLRLLDRLMFFASEYYTKSTLNHPSWGTEHVNLSPTLRIAAGIPLPTPELREEVKQTIARNAAEHEEVRLAAIPFKPATIVGVHKRVALTIGVADTRRLIAAAKAVSATVTHAYHAAIALALRDRQVDHTGGKVRYFAGALIDHRKDCLNYGSPLHVAAVLHSGSGWCQPIDMQVPGPYTAEGQRTEFLQTLSKFTEFYIALKDDKQHLAKYGLFYESIMPNLTAETLAGDIPDVPPPPSNPLVTFSSMGKFDGVLSSVYGDFKVDDPWITGEELRNGLGLYLSSWSGEMTLSLAYNDAYHHEDEAVDYLNSCQRILDNGLAVQECTTTTT